METRLIEDGQITASSEYSSNHAAIQARLNFKAGGGKQGGWSARYSDAKQWIQVALGSYTTLTGIATQGRNDYDQWVTSYYLQYSDDGVTFDDYKEPDYNKAPSEWSPKVKPYLPEGNFQSLHSFMSTVLLLSIFQLNVVHWRYIFLLFYFIKK